MNKMIAAQDNKVMPWKNGLGTTAEIEIFPTNAVFSDNTFDYRLSSAKITSATPFSKYPGFDRVLCVIEGKGLLINNKRHEAFKPFHFAGEDAIHSVPLGREVLDLGIIYRRDLFHADMKEFFAAVSPEPEKWKISSGVHFIVCTEGSLQINEFFLKKGDVLKCDTNQELMVSTEQGARGMIIYLVTR